MIPQAGVSAHLRGLLMHRNESIDLIDGTFFKSERERDIVLVLIIHQYYVYHE